MSNASVHLKGDRAATNETDVRFFLGMPAVVSGARIQALLRLAERMAQGNAAVLVTGESGSGKELIARAIHVYSKRSSQPWIDINCAALPEHLLESELFGYEKGAFSGADSSKQGLFELAHHGTLFLDEIGELSSASQSKLLRVLDGCPHYRLGGTRKIDVDVRIVAATNADLEQEVRAKRFRADLFHRLNQMRLEVPPLRERPDDVGPLAGFFLEQARSEITISGDAIAALEHCAWPGNIRELRNLIARLIVTANGGVIDREDLPAEYRSASESADSTGQGYSLQKVEQDVILQALEQANGRRNRAAELLGISRRTLIRRLKTYGVGHKRALSCGSVGCD